VGVILVSLAWFAWSMVLILVAVGIGLVKPEAFQAMFGTADIPLTYLDTVVMLLIALATIWGFSFGVWAVVKLLHKRQLDTVVGWNRRFSLSQFGAGCIIAAGYLAISMTWSFVSGNAPRRSELELGTWLIALGPIALVVFFQAASEEIVFRGYLPQQLAARWRHPLVWGFLPAFVFGLAHSMNGRPLDEFTIYHVVAATMHGPRHAGDGLAHRQSLAAAIGFHFINNIGAILVVGHLPALTADQHRWRRSRVDAGSQADGMGRQSDCC
jgi:membrane protease YdiL (CAAX protease family)